MLGPPSDHATYHDDGSLPSPDVAPGHLRKECNSLMYNGLSAALDLRARLRNAGRARAGLFVLCAHVPLQPQTPIRLSVAGTRTGRKSSAIITAPGETSGPVAEPTRRDADSPIGACEGRGVRRPGRSRVLGCRGDPCGRPSPTIVVARADVLHEFGTGRDKPVPSHGTKTELLLIQRVGRTPFNIIQGAQAATAALVSCPSAPRSPGVETFVEDAPRERSDRRCSFHQRTAWLGRRRAGA